MRGVLQNYGRIGKDLARSTKTEEILKMRHIDSRKSEKKFYKKGNVVIVLDSAMINNYIVIKHENTKN